MAYIDRDGLEQRFGADEIGKLLDDDGDADGGTGGAEAGEVEALDRAIEDAASLIDGFLAVKNPLPLTAPFPTLVVNWSADIVRFKLWDERAPAEVRQRYEDVLKQLEQLAKGLIALPPAPEAASTGVVFGGYSACRVFDEDSLAAY